MRISFCKGEGTGPMKCRPSGRGQHKAGENNTLQEFKAKTESGAGDWTSSQVP